MDAIVDPGRDDDRVGAYLRVIETSAEGLCAVGFAHPRSTCTLAVASFGFPHVSRRFEFVWAFSADGASVQNLYHVVMSRLLLFHIQANSHIISLVQF